MAEDLRFDGQVTAVAGSGSGRGPGAQRFVGSSVLRREDPRLVTGHGRFVDDIRLPGMLHATFVRSPFARAAIRRLDASAALAVPGVVAVLTGEEADLPAIGYAMPSTAELQRKAPLAVGDVRFVGDPVAIVIAESRHLAEDAAELVVAEFDPAPPVIDLERAGEAAPVHPDLESNVAWSGASASGPAVQAALAAADHVFTETFHQHRYQANPMETHGIVAAWDAVEGTLTLNLATQMPHNARAHVSKVLGIDEHRVRVIMGDVGGGFGAKGFMMREEFCVAYASRRLGRPIKWIEDRSEHLLASSSSRHEFMTVTFGVSSEGIVGAAAIEHVVDLGAHPVLMPEAIPAIAAKMFPGPYKIPHYAWSARALFTNTAPLSPYRGPWMMETTAREQMMDLVARELGLDPAELRRRNVIGPEDQPYTTPGGAVYKNISPDRTLEQALELADYAGFRARQAAGRREGRYLGLGMSLCVEPTAQSVGRATGHEVATVRVEPSGKVVVTMGLASHGQGNETTMAQVVADGLGIDLDDVVYRQGDTHSAPFGGGNGGSRAAVVGGAAARVAAAQMREKVLRIAEHVLEAAAEDLEIEHGVITVKGSPDASMTVADVAGIAYMDPLNLPEGMEPGLELTSRYAVTEVAHANAMHICVCEVDVETGQVTVDDYIVSEDCGVMINPMIVEGQVAGGAIQGIGGVLFEHAVVDDDGVPQAITFKDYLLPTAANVPDVRLGHVTTPSSSPGGHKGTGEGGAIAASAAVANAVRDALTPFGVRLTRQPLTPSRLLEELDAAQARRG